MPWYASFGGFVLCSRDAGIDIELEGVRFEQIVPAKRAYATVRTITPGRLEEVSPREIGGYLPFYTARGRPPDFSERYAGPPAPGDYSRNVDGMRVVGACADSEASLVALSRSRPVGDEILELVFVMKVGPQGARVRRAYIDYLADGEPMTLKLRWDMVACGDAITSRRLC